jgi:hypothetical protein
VTLLVTAAAECDEISRPLVPAPLVRQVVNIEVLAASTVLAKPTRPLNDCTSALPPLRGLEVTPIFALAFEPSFATAAPRETVGVAGHEADCA